MKPLHEDAEPGPGANGLRKDRRRWQRVAVQLPMRFMLENGEECAGETVSASGGGFSFRSDRALHRGERLIAYIESLGRISGIVVRAERGIAVVESDASPARRDKLADQLTWLTNKDKLGLDEERRAERVQGGGTVKAILEDGREISCQVIDMSFVGAGLATRDKRPMVGETVKLGPQTGRVARYLPEGFAVDFTRRGLV